MNPSLATPPPIERIVLTGFMGSGKSTVGRILAARLGWRFIDLDDRVEAREGRSVPQVFAEQGEAAFRAAETAALAELLQTSKTVIALGGGAPVTPGIRELLAGSLGTPVVYLQAPFAVVYDRCAAQALDSNATERPLLGERGAAEARYRQREAIYAAIAHHTADASIETPEAIARAIFKKLTSAPDSML